MDAKKNSWEPHFAGDQCLILEFGQTIDRELVNRVVAMNARISAAILSRKIQGVLECIPTFRSLAVMFDPLSIHPEQLITDLRALDSDTVSEATSSGKTLYLPVHYGEESGPDLERVAAMTGLDEQKVIDLHQQTEFSVYMLGFLPGFAFLGDTPSELHLPRRAEPRVRVPAGSVAIAMQLTGVYPWDSPGGWHILGKCPVPLFDGKLNPPAIFTAGDTVRFRAIDLPEFNAITEQKTQAVFDRATLLTSASSA
ncbi:MAG: inhibitor of KinA [Granulosicoccus sp.]|jgi:inhibitor of KinA